MEQRSLGRQGCACHWSGWAATTSAAASTTRRRVRWCTRRSISASPSSTPPMSYRSESAAPRSSSARRWVRGARTSCWRPRSACRWNTGGAVHRATRSSPAVEASLRRLNTDWIDLYQQHQPDPLTPIEETLRAFDDLVRQGKVRYIGCSNLRAWQVVEARWTSRTLGLAPFVSCQNEYSLLMREPDRELIPMMQAYGMGLLPYYPLASGAADRQVPAQHADARRARGSTVHGARYGDRFINDANWPIVERLEAFAAAARQDAAGAGVQLARGAAMRIQHHRRRDEAGAVGGERARRGLGADRGGAGGDRSDHAAPVTSLASPDSRRARIASSQCRRRTGRGCTASTSTPSRQRTLTLNRPAPDRGV